MSRTVMVLGHRGMLGHMVARYLRERGYGVVTIASRFEAGREIEFLAEIRRVDAAAVVNCVGVRTTDVDSSSELFRINGTLPQLLAANLGGALLVQPSTDAVFSGEGGPFAVSREPNATDPYGLSKRLGERCLELGRSVVLRTSLVGPEESAARSLLAWLAAQRGEVRGYTDQLWNGITTLCFAKLCERAVEGEFGPGIHQPATEVATTKYELLEALRDAFDIDVSVVPAESGKPLDRRLVPTEVLVPIREQLRELRDFCRGESAS